jgi:hypothetical protein
VSAGVNRSLGDGGSSSDGATARRGAGRAPGGSPEFVAWKLPDNELALTGVMWPHRQPPKGICRLELARLAAKLHDVGLAIPAISSNERRHKRLGGASGRSCGGGR